MRGMHQKGMRGKSNVITKLRKRNVEKVWGVRYTLGARYLSKNTVYKFCGVMYTVCTGHGLVTGSFECSNEPSGSKNVGNISSSCGMYQLLRTGCAAWSILRCYSTCPLAVSYVESSFSVSCCIVAHLSSCSFVNNPVIPHFLSVKFLFNSV